ncbi:MAG: hypothetical protein V4506_06570 [Bacteroidota bacterium]
MNSTITKSERQKIKANLKFGDIALISRLSGKSASTIKRWFKNEGDSIEIPKAIMQMYETREKTVKSFKNSLNSLGI